MELSLSLNDFKTYVSRQINHFFPDNFKADFCLEEQAFDYALQRTEHCFNHVSLAAYKINGLPYLNHLHSDQYCVFLWFLSNSVWSMQDDQQLANKLFYLNKSLHGFSCMYDTELPDIFVLLHTVGTVLGRAKYSDYLVAFQGSTVGAQKGRYPRLGRGVSLLPYSSIVGDCRIGDYVSIGNSASVYEKNIADHTVVFKDDSGSNTYKINKASVSERYFNMNIS